MKTKESISVDIPDHVHKVDAKYYLDGKWICGKSSTGAHHWINDSAVTRLVCKWCKKEQEV